MKVLNIGSLNCDHVYLVDHFVRPGETLGCENYRKFPGGKGLNQSIALANAGARVFHCGKIGADGGWLRERLERHGVDTRYIATASGAPTGHAIIQVESSGENAIVIVGGANQQIDQTSVECAIRDFQRGDILLVQNETSAIAGAIEAARRRGMFIVMNPAPMNARVLDYPLACVDLFIVNETEARGLTAETAPGRIQAVMRERFPKSAVVLTLGEKGAIYWDSQTRREQPAEKVAAVDTTAAGDTFTGFYLAEWIRTSDPLAALRMGCRAAAICVTRPGAADSIPTRAEIQ